MGWAPGSTAMFWGDKDGFQKLQLSCDMIHQKQHGCNYRCIMAHTHHHHPHLPPTAAPALDGWAGLLLSSSLMRVLGAGGVCALMWSALWWAMR